MCLKGEGQVVGCKDLEMLLQLKIFVIEQNVYMIRIFFLIL